MEFVEKSLWLATNFAAKMIKETGYRNKSIKKAANYYNVNVEDVEKELIKRQKRGQKGIGSKGDKYKYFVYIGLAEYYYGDNFDTEKVEYIKKSKTSENARNSFADEMCHGGKSNMISGKYIEKSNWEKAVKEFENKKDAENYLQAARHDVEPKSDCF